MSVYILKIKCTSCLSIIVLIVQKKKYKPNCIECETMQN